MKRAIIVRGSSGCGKTQSLINFYNWIKANFNITILSIIPHSNGDFEVVFSFGKLKVSYFTQGDYGHEVDRFLKDSLAANSDLIICCCRTRGGTFDAIHSNLYYPNFLIDFINVHKVSASSVSSFLLLKQEELKARIIGFPKP